MAVTSSGIEVVTDTSLSVYRSNGLLPAIGFYSKFTDEPHPGTNQEIVGWEWDQRLWSSQLERSNLEFSPSIWDPDNTPLKTTDFQSGVGDNRELKVEGINLVFPSGQRDIWAPCINHGNYYNFDKKFYLYSDSSVTETFPDTTFSGVNTLELDFNPKDGIPITVTKFEWDDTNRKWDKFLDFTHKFEFTGLRSTPSGARLDTQADNGDILFSNIDPSFPEFVVDHRSDPITIYLNNDYIQTHGVTPSNSGLKDMELLGTATGSDEEEFRTRFSPVIDSGVRIVSYFNEDGPFKEWDIVEDITASGQVLFDYDLGIAKFGTGENFHPAGGAQVSAFYKSTISVEYEPDNTTNIIKASEADVNPMGRTSSNGFIYLKQEVIEPASITLEADTTLISADFYGPVFLGTGFLKLFATVTSENGELVEGEEVTFILNNGVGSFSGGQDTIESLTNFQGIAQTTLSIPKSVENIGGIGEVVTQGSPEPDQTTITMSGVDLIGDATTWSIYKVFSNDPVLGLDSAKQYYIDFFEEEEIYYEDSTHGTHPTAELNEDGTGWENTHRLLTGLLTPTLYDAEFRNGRKQLLVTFNDEAIDPHDFTDGAFIPVRPLSFTTAGSNTTNVVVSGILDTPGSGINDRLAGYFIAGPTVARLQASVFNERSGETILSNEIDVEIRVPKSMDGTILIEGLNEIQRLGIFGSSEPSAPTEGILPLGFRLRSTGVTLAGVLGGLTYLDVNSPTEKVGHTFTVVESGVS